MAGRILEVALDLPAEVTVEKVASVLLQGGVAVYPSDTVYGLLADAGSMEACLRMSSLKGYESPRPFIILVDGIEAALLMTSDRNARTAMEKYWPGPVTLLFPASADVPVWLRSVSDSVALRYPADLLSTELLANTGTNLVSTSANIRNGPNPLSVDDIPEEIREGADIILDGGVLSGRKPSRIIDLTGDQPATVR